MEELEELWLELLEVELLEPLLAMPWKTLCLVKKFQFDIIETIHSGGKGKGKGKGGKSGESFFGGKGKGKGGKGKRRSL